MRRWAGVGALAMLALGACRMPGQKCATPDSMRAKLAGQPNADTLADLGILLANEKQYACAANAFSASLKLKPDSENVLFMFGTSLFFAGNAEEAVAPLQAAEQIEGRNLKTHLLLGAVLDQLHRFDEAKREWQAALDADPESTEALDGLAQDYVQAQEFGAAIALLENPRAERQRTATQSLSLGMAYAGTGKLDAAIGALRDGLNTTPESAALVNALEDMLVQAGRVEDASVVFGVARARHPEDVETGLHFLRLLMASDPEKAKPVGEELLQAFPKSWETRYLNGVLAMEEQDFARARLYLSQSIALNAEFAMAHSALGVVLARLNDLEGAKAELERAIALGDTSPEVQENLERVTRANARQ